MLRRFPSVRLLFSPSPLLFPQPLLIRLRSNTVDRNSNAKWGMHSRLLPPPEETGSKGGTSHLYELGFGSLASNPSLSLIQFGGHYGLERAKPQAPLTQDGVRYQLLLTGKADLHGESWIMQ